MFFPAFISSGLLICKIISVQNYRDSVGDFYANQIIEVHSFKALIMEEMNQLLQKFVENKENEIAHASTNSSALLNSFTEGTC
jgi:hypothetical protein